MSSLAGHLWVASVLIAMLACGSPPEPTLPPADSPTEMEPEPSVEELSARGAPSVTALCERLAEISTALPREAFLDAVEVPPAVREGTLQSLSCLNSCVVAETFWPGGDCWLRIVLRGPLDPEPPPVVTDAAVECDDSPVVTVCEQAGLVRPDS